MKIKDLDNTYEIQKMLTSLIPNIDERGKFIDRGSELSYLLQCLSLCDLSECEYKKLRENIEKIINILHLNYDNIIEEKRKEEENDNN